MTASHMQIQDPGESNIDTGLPRYRAIFQVAIVCITTLIPTLTYLADFLKNTVFDSGLHQLSIQRGDP